MSTERKLPPGWGLVNCEEENEKNHREFAKLLELRYDAERVSYSMAMQISFFYLDVPEDAVIEGAMKQLRLKGWRVDFIEANDTGGRSGSFIMDAPANR